LQASRDRKAFEIDGRKPFRSLPPHTSLPSALERSRQAADIKRLEEIERS
jgi:hypothetical protein